MLCAAVMLHLRPGFLQCVVLIEPISFSAALVLTISGLGILHMPILWIFSFRSDDNLQFRMRWLGVMVPWLKA